MLCKSKNEVFVSRTIYVSVLVLFVASRRHCTVLICFLVSFVHRIVCQSQNMYRKFANRRRASNRGKRKQSKTEFRAQAVASMPVKYV